LAGDDGYELHLAEEGDFGGREAGREREGHCGRGFIESLVLRWVVLFVAVDENMCSYDKIRVRRDGKESRRVFFPRENFIRLRRDGRKIKPVAEPCQMMMSVL
jgi:hypothetical protein